VLVLIYSFLNFYSSDDSKPPAISPIPPIILAVAAPLANFACDCCFAKQKYQDTLIDQGQRVQDSEIAGEIFQYQAHEARSNADIERYQGMYSGFAKQQSQAKLARGAATASMIGGIGDIAGGLLSSDE
jgi:hypothetical protein